jgi:Flp pilus assembly protein CpaB
MVLAGIAFFVVGASIVFLVSRNDTSGTSGAPQADEVDVVVAKDTISIGTNGDDVLSQNLYDIKRVPVSTKLPDALLSPSELSNTIVTRQFTKGEQITRGGLDTRSQLSSVIQIPDGYEAVPVAADFVAGGAGYLAPGDLVNVYAVINPTSEIVPTGADVSGNSGTGGTSVALDYAIPRVELLLTNVEVLDVQTEIAPFRASTSANEGDTTAARATTGTTMTVLLAVVTTDAEKLIFQSAIDTNALYLSRVGDKAAPAGPTPGQDYFTIFEQEPNDAYNRAPHS